MIVQTLTATESYHAFKLTGLNHEEYILISHCKDGLETKFKKDLMMDYLIYLAQSKIEVSWKELDKNLAAIQNSVVHIL